MACLIDLSLVLCEASVPLSVVASLWDSTGEATATQRQAVCKAFAAEAGLATVPPTVAAAFRALSGFEGPRRVALHAALIDAVAVGIENSETPTLSDLQKDLLEA